MTISSLSFEAEVLIWMGMAVCCFGAAAWLTLPRSLRDRSVRCAYRGDGSFSGRRRQIELDERTKFVGHVMGLLLLSSLPLLFTAFLIHQWVVPAGLAVEAVPSIVSDRDPSSARNQEIQAQSREQLQKEGHSPETIRMIQSAAWNGFPAAVVLMLLLCFGSISFLLKSIQRQVRRFRRSLDRRCREYDEADLEDFERRIQQAPESQPVNEQSTRLA